MKELILLLAVVAGSYFVGTQVREKRAAPVDQRTVVQRPRPSQLAAQLADRREEIQKQDALIENLEKRISQSNEAIEAINTQLTQNSEAEPQLGLDQIADQLKAAQLQLQQSQSSLQQTGDQAMQQLIAEDQQAVVKRQEQLATAQRMRDRIRKEQDYAAWLRSILLQLLTTNIVTDATRELEPQVYAQEAKIQSLQEQYRQYELQNQQAAAAMAETRQWQRDSLQSKTRTEGSKELNERQEQVESLEAQYQAKQKQQQAQRAEHEKLADQYQTLQAQRDELLGSYAAQKKKLEEMKAAYQPKT